MSFSQDGVRPCKGFVDYFVKTGYVVPPDTGRVCSGQIYLSASRTAAAVPYVLFLLLVPKASLYPANRLRRPAFF